MKLKRTVCLILSIMVVLSVLSGCQAESAATVNPTQDTTPSKTQATENAVKFNFILEAVRVVVDGVVHT